MSFSSLGLPDYLLESVKRAGYTQATPIQTEAIPAIIEGKDLLAQAQTGTGKTAAFALPMLKHLNELPKKKKKISVLSVIIAPTRELVIQLAAALKTYQAACPNQFKILTVIGGEPIKQQITGLRHGADIVIATPGRFIELAAQKEIRLFELQHFVIDEADKMLDLGFADEIDALLKVLPKNRQNLLFSATFPKKVREIAEKLLNDPVRLEMTVEQPTVETIKQRVIEVERDQRTQLLRQLITTEKWAHSLIFVASKRSARNLAGKLNKYGIKALQLHGDLNQEQRIEALQLFKKKKAAVLIATDIAARGIDIDGLTHVVNYDLPRAAADYIHRIGRTGRAGAEGSAISFISAEDQNHFRHIEKTAKIKLVREQFADFND